MNKLTSAKRAAVVAALVEGNSMRSTCRMTGVSLPTVTKLLTDLGEVCARYQDAMLRHLTCTRIECDEIWSFVGAKQKNVPKENRHFGIGDVWTWTSLCADTKLVPTWYVGPRDAIAAHWFMRDLASRIPGRLQLTTDAFRPYPDAVEEAFGSRVDYATMQKNYSTDIQGQSRYSPPKILSTVTEVIKGNPDPALISTSYCADTKLKTTRVTPAMAANVSDHVWGLDELIGLLEIREEIKRVA